jgi:hypothetical protein
MYLPRSPVLSRLFEIKSKMKRLKLITTNWR